MGGKERYNPFTLDKTFPLFSVEKSVSINSKSLYRDQNEKNGLYLVSILTIWSLFSKKMSMMVESLKIYLFEQKEGWS